MLQQCYQRNLKKNWNLKVLLSYNDWVITFCLGPVPVKLAVAISDRVSTPAAEQGAFKKFIEELQLNLNSTGTSPEFLAKLIPEYLTLTLMDEMSTGELVAFKNKIEKDLTHGYNFSHSEKARKLYKARAFNSIMMKLDPHGLKFIQTLRAKDPTSWIADVYFDSTKRSSCGIRTSS